MIVGVLILVVIVGFLMQSVRKPKNFPPGPTPLPIIGSVLAVNRKNHQQTINDFHETYGSRVGLLMGGFKLVLVNGWEAINEALTNEDLLGRPDVCLSRDRFEGGKYGFIFNDGDDWRTQRRFTLHHFRNLGFGRSTHEAYIQEEAEELVEAIRGKRGKPFQLEEFVGLANLNMTWALLGGQRYDYSNQEIINLRLKIRESNQGTKIFGNIAVQFPFLRYIFPQATGYNGIVKTYRVLTNFVQKVIRQHETTRDPNNPRDFIDIYLEELSTPDVKSSFSKPQLVGICIDMLVAGGDTTTTLINFAIFFLCLRKDLQNKIYEEIMEHVGSNRLPSLKDKSNLVYTEALLLETLRMRSPLPTVPHRAVRDTILGSHYIPKDTFVMMNINSVLMDKLYWEDPEFFNPDRFITPEGNVRSDERLIAFGKGKRDCIGNNLARSSSFLFVASIVQNFSFEFDPNLPVPGTEGVPGMTLAAPCFQVVATPREQTLSS